MEEEGEGETQKQKFPRLFFRIYVVGIIKPSIPHIQRVGKRGEGDEMRFSTIDFT